MTIHKLLSSSAVLACALGKNIINSQIKLCLRLFVHSILAIIFLLGALVALSLAAYMALGAVLPAAVVWLFLGLVYALAATILYIRVLNLSCRT